MTLRFLILGSPEVHGNAGMVGLGGPSRALFTALAVSTNTPVTTARLAEAMWENRPAKMATELDSAAEELRRTLRSAGELADGRLVKRSDSLLLSVEMDELDLDRFTLLFRQGRAALEAEDHYAAAHLLGHASTLWRGPAGADCQGYGWLRRRLDDIDQLRSSATEGLLLARLALGQAPQVIAESRALVAAEPLDERWWACLIAGLRDVGDAEAAQQAHEQARQAYMERLGLLPDQVRRLLHLALLPPQLRQAAHWMAATANQPVRRNSRTQPRGPRRWTNSRADNQDRAVFSGYSGPVQRTGPSRPSWPPTNSSIS